MCTTPAPPRFASQFSRRRQKSSAHLGELAFDQFHHQCVLFDAVNRRDIGVIERRQNLRLALESMKRSGSR